MLNRVNYNYSALATSHRDCMKIICINAKCTKKAAFNSKSYGQSECKRLGLNLCSALRLEFTAFVHTEKRLLIQNDF